jgi:hypothetical protein
LESILVQRRGYTMENASVFFQIYTIDLKELASRDKTSKLRYLKNNDKELHTSNNAYYPEMILELSIIEDDKNNKS